MSRARQVMSAVVTALRTCPTVAGDASRVMVGATAMPAAPPRVYIGAPAITSEHDNALGSYRRTMTLAIVAYTAGATPEERVGSAMDLADEMARALETDRHLTTGGVRLVEDVIISFDAFDGEALDIRALGVVTGELGVWWYATSGVGT